MRCFPLDVALVVWNRPIMKVIGTARLFGSDSPPAGEEAYVSIVGDRVEVRASSRVHTPLLADLSIREAGTTSGRLELSWNSDQGVHAVQISDPQALQVLEADPGFRASPQMAALRR